MKYSLVGVDGNAFAVLGYTANALKTDIQLMLLKQKDCQILKKKCIKKQCQVHIIIC